MVRQKVILLILLGIFLIGLTSANSFAYNYLVYTPVSTGDSLLQDIYTPPFTEWINSSTTLQTSTSLVPVYITNLNATLLANSYYSYYCRITYASNVTTNGIRIGLMTLTNPPDMTFNIKIPQAGAGTDSFMEWQGDAWILNVTSTGVISTAVNYTAIIEGDIRTNGNNNWLTPYFGSENTTRLTNVTRGFCKWTKIN